MHRKKIIAARIMGTSPKKVRFAAEALPEIEKAITRSDFRGLIAVGKITAPKRNLRSRAGARLNKAQKRKGRRRGKGSRKGSRYSIISRKQQWVNQMRAQRDFLQRLRKKNLLSGSHHRILYDKSKGGFFRNVRHIKLYVTEHHLLEAPVKAEKVTTEEKTDITAKEPEKERGEERKEEWKSREGGEE